MSVRFSADSIVASSSSINITSQYTAQMNGQASINSCSSKMETQALMDTTPPLQHHHQGRPRTPDANNEASYMSSDFNTQQQEQHLNNNNINTSQEAVFDHNAQDLFAKLSEALALEPKYQPNLFLPLQSNVSVCFYRRAPHVCNI